MSVYLYGMASGFGIMLAIALVMMVRERWQELLEVESIVIDLQRTADATDEVLKGAKLKMAKVKQASEQS